jgi:hypothetical protein
MRFPQGDSGVGELIGEGRGKLQAGGTTGLNRLRKKSGSEESLAKNVPEGLMPFIF